MGSLVFFQSGRSAVKLAFRKGFGNPGRNEQPDAGRPDKDGLSNLLEYSLGSDPLQANKFNVDLVREGNLIRITYVRRKTSTDSNLSYFLEESSDLNVWTTVEASIEEDADQSDLPDGESAGNSQFERVAAVHDLGDIPPPRSF